MIGLTDVIKVFLRKGDLSCVDRSGQRHYFVTVPAYQDRWVILRKEFPWIEELAVLVGLLEGCEVLLQGVYCPEFVESEEACLAWWEMIRERFESFVGRSQYGEDRESLPGDEQERADL